MSPYPKKRLWPLFWQFYRFAYVIKYSNHPKTELEIAVQVKLHYILLHILHTSAILFITLKQVCSTLYVMQITLAKFGLHAGIYNYMPGANHISRVYNVRGILWLQCVVRVMLFSMTDVLYSYVSTIKVCAQCPVWLLFVVPWCHAFPGVNSTPNRNESQGYLLGVKVTVHTADILATFMCQLSRNSGSHNLLQPKGPV